MATVQSKDVQYRCVAMDEWGNGQFPVIYAAVFSCLDSEIVETGQLFPKRKQTPATLPDELVSRHYTFLEYNQDHNQIVGPVKTPGIVLASLVYGVPVDKDISVCIDGELKPKQLEFIATVLEDVVGPGNIHIYKGGNLDRRIMLVSMAHHTASWLAGKPADIRSGNPRKKVILAELIEKYC